MYLVLISSIGHRCMRSVVLYQSDKMWLTTAMLDLAGLQASINHKKKLIMYWKELCYHTIAGSSSVYLHIPLYLLCNTNKLIFLCKIQRVRTDKQ